jgi:hypothetical protein
MEKQPCQRAVILKSVCVGFGIFHSQAPFSVFILSLSESIIKVPNNFCRQRKTGRSSLPASAEVLCCF